MSYLSGEHVLIMDSSDQLKAGWFIFVTFEGWINCRVRIAHTLLSLA